MRRSTITAISILLVGILAACGSDDDTSTPSEPSESDGATSEPASTGDGDAPDTDDTDSGENQSATGGVGTVTANGETHSFDQVINCEPPDAGIPNHEELLAVSALGADGMALHVRLSTIMEDESQAVDWYGPDGAYQGSATDRGDTWFGGPDVSYDDAPLTFADGRITGTITVINTRATDESFDIDLDVPYPSEITDC